ncbi:MAG: hypothetical protein HY722_10240 [Planctomycetes bacterium]|nr:hypothetical protein [Planctomycetota bacterium]
MRARERRGRAFCPASRIRAGSPETHRLRERVRALEAENALLRKKAGEAEVLKRKLEAAKARVRELEAALVEARRSQHRQAAPFRRDDEKKDKPSPEPANLGGKPTLGGPPRPGRKLGHPAANRARLKPDRFQENLFPRDQEGKPSCPGCNA